MFNCINNTLMKKILTTLLLFLGTARQIIAMPMLTREMVEKNLNYTCEIVKPIPLDDMPKRFDEEADIIALGLESLIMLSANTSDPNEKAIIEEYFKSVVSGIAFSSDVEKLFVEMTLGDLLYCIKLRQLHDLLGD